MIGMNRMRLTILLSIPWLAVHLNAAVDFARDVRPILAENCIECHGGVKQAGGVSFIYRNQVFGEGKSGERTVAPGDLEASELFYRITTDDEDDRMPPMDEHPEGLSDQEIATIERWIAEGAVWSDHWAFVPPKVPALPEVSDETWTRNGIDYFVMARLDAEGLDPAPEAAPERWLRRVSLDLTGLPPTPKERATFLRAVTARGESAFEYAVDRLLDSPHFGERQATIWLDLVRYADSKGLGQDGRRTIWKYRDWVIGAFNDDLPYDEFTVQQIAGDLLPEATVGQRIATAAHRLTQTNEEGGADDEEFRIAATLDRVNTTWQTWQGLTFGCAQCHDHPYDPFRHEEYYKFVAFFNNTRDVDLNEEWPILRAPLDPSRYPEASQLDREIETLREQIWAREYSQLSDSTHWRPLREIEINSNQPTKVVVEPKSTHDEFHTVDTVSQRTEFTILAPVPKGVERITALRFTGLPLDPKTAVADSEWGFVLSHIDARLIVPGEKAARNLEFIHAIGDEPNPFHDPRQSLDGRSSSGFGAYSRIHYPRQAAFTLERPIEVPEGSRIEVILKHRITSLGAFPLVTKRGHLAVTDDPAFTALQNDRELIAKRKRLERLAKRRADMPSAPIAVLAERPASLKRPTHVFVRGLFLTKSQQVEANTPEYFSPLNAEGATDRLALARWLVRPDNSLTARVAVNRFWARMFGVGLVGTEEDFGSSGEAPSHPKLLDYLATRFQNELDWSLKGLLREIALSGAYRQSSKIRPSIHERDPDNRLIARGPRHRLPAETVRDQALAAAGLLNRELFGPPVHPPIPDGVWKPFQGGDRWKTPAPGEPNRYRRSIYTYTKRTIPYPMFAVFDSPSREFCAPRRLRSNTPLQAFMTLNDETFMDCSRALARRMKNETRGGIDNSIRHGYLLATGLEPSPAALDELKALFEKTNAAYLEGGDVDSSEDATLTVVANVLLNLDETLMK